MIENLPQITNQGYFMVRKGVKTFITPEDIKLAESRTMLPIVRSTDKLASTTTSNSINTNFVRTSQSMASITHTKINAPSPNNHFLSPSYKPPRPLSKRTSKSVSLVTASTNQDFFSSQANSREHLRNETEGDQSKMKLSQVPANRTLADCDESFNLTGRSRSIFDRYERYLDFYHCRAYEKRDRMQKFRRKYFISNPHPLDDTKDQINLVLPSMNKSRLVNLSTFLKSDQKSINDSSVVQNPFILENNKSLSKAQGLRRNEFYGKHGRRGTEPEFKTRFKKIDFVKLDNKLFGDFVGRTEHARVLKEKEKSRPIYNQMERLDQVKRDLAKLRATKHRKSIYAVMQYSREFEAQVKMKDEKIARLVNGFKEEFGIKDQ